MLRQIVAAVKDMGASEDAYEQERRWNEFLVNADAFYIRFQSDIKQKTASPADWAWLQCLLKERDEDPLLDYIQHARHDVVHGNAEVGIVGQYITVNLAIVEAYKLLPNPKPEWAAFLHNHPQTIKEPMPIKLRPVERRGARGVRKSKKTGLVDPPLEHLGKPYFRLDPPFLAGVALEYFSAKFREAELLREN